MSTRFIWTLPAFYQTPTRQPLEFDLTQHGKKILTNKVWERRFDYGYTDSLKKLNPEDIIRIGITITPLPQGIHPVDKPENILQKFCGRVPEHNEVILHANLSQWIRNILVIEAEFGFDSEMPKSITDLNDTLSMEFVETFHRLVAFAEEIGALFRATTHIMFHSDYPIIPSMAKRSQGGGLIYVESNNKWLFDLWSTATFTFPAIYMETHLEDFEALLDLMANLWHLTLWPVHRFLKALNAEYIEIENLLDLLYALEGVFPKNTSSEFIRVAAALFLSNNRGEAKEINEFLKQAFQIRNDIVHGAQHYTGLEKVKLEGQEVLSQKVFWKVRRIVAKMIYVAIQKLVRTQGMRSLRINVQDLLEKMYP